MRPKRTSLQVQLWEMRQSPIGSQIDHRQQVVSRVLVQEEPLEILKRVPVDRGYSQKKESKIMLMKCFMEVQAKRQLLSYSWLLIHSRVWKPKEVYLSHSIIMDKQDLVIKSFIIRVH